MEISISSSVVIENLQTVIGNLFLHNSVAALAAAENFLSEIKMSVANEEADIKSSSCSYIASDQRLSCADCAYFSECIQDPEEWLRED